MSATRQAEASSSSSELDPHPNPNPNSMPPIRKSKSKCKNKRRFSHDQIRTLESLFEMETRPELQTKQQLATELGLQPRQVAIWFQNKRARSKSKLIEKQYNMLKSSYDALVSKFDSLKNENQCLLLQLQRLREQMGKPQQNSNLVVGQTAESINMQYSSIYMDTNEEKEKRNQEFSCKQHEMLLPFYSESSENAEHFDEETNILKLAEGAGGGCLTLAANLCSFDSNYMSSCLPDHPSCSLQWWNL
ncbi:hypothetical protein NMG60_11030612 [Bertholletia excelsa]